MYTTHGGSLRHSLLGIALIITVIAVLSAATRAFTGPIQRGAAGNEARNWARDVHLQVDAITCKDVDSDGDGHVSCTVAAAGKLYDIECPGAWNVGHGCRTPKPSLFPRRGWQ